MNRYSIIMPVFMVVLMAASVYMRFDEVAKNVQEYEEYLSAARASAETGVTKTAMENYNLALSVNPSVELYCEIADYYSSQGDVESYTEWCEAILEKYPTRTEGYDRMLNLYLSDNNYSMAFSIIRQAKKRGVSSDALAGAESELAYSFWIDHRNYEEIGQFCNGYCAVKTKDGKWGFISSSGANITKFVYDSAGAFLEESFAPVTVSDTEAYFIDTTDSKILASKEKYKSFGNYNDDVIPAQLENGKYIYTDRSFQPINDRQYDYASTMASSIAAVKDGNEWYLIDKGGNKIIDVGFSDIKLDRRGIACLNDRIFAKQSDGYLMLDTSGNQVSQTVYEDVQPFIDTTYTAVRSDGQWYFIDKDGNRMSEQTYEEARPFSNGLAGVKVNGEWGFIDSSGNMVIQPQFANVDAFTSNGCCLVSEEDGMLWQILKLYRME